jgi:DNA gyrase/topoisomerase IV subunit A
VGNQMVKLEGEDYCVGCCAINPEAHFIVMVTEKGCVKKSEIEFLGKPSATKATSYLATLDANDSLIYADTPLKSVDVCTRLGHTELTLDEIKTLSRKAKPVRKVQLASGDNIIRVVTH